MVGVSTIGSISLGEALVAGKKRVPNPAAGITAFFTIKFFK
jgi:ABC-type microcin C transport system permease subunit YejE